MRFAAPAFLILLSMPAFASDLDEIQGWRATSTITVNAEPSYVMAAASDLTTWKTWTAWSSQRDPAATWEYQGKPDTVGHEMTWDGPELDEGRLVITGVTAEQFTYDLFFGNSKKAAKGVFSAVAVEGGTAVTWDTAGPMGAVGRMLFANKVGTMVQADFDKGLGNLKSLAEHNKQVAEMVAKAVGLAKAATAAEGDAAKMATAERDAKVKVDEATYEMSKAKKKKEVEAAQAKLDAAKTAHGEAVAAAATAAADAKKARSAADSAKAAVTAVAGSTSVVEEAMKAEATAQKKQAAQADAQPKPAEEPAPPAEEPAPAAESDTQSEAASE